jgi:hypothetical protein
MGFGATPSETQRHHVAGLIGSSPRFFEVETISVSRTNRFAMKTLPGMVFSRWLG